jgi:hypothetical protein
MSQHSATHDRSWNVDDDQQLTRFTHGGVLLLPRTREQTDSKRVRVRSLSVVGSSALAWLPTRQSQTQSRRLYPKRRQTLWWMLRDCLTSQHRRWTRDLDTTYKTPKKREKGVVFSNVSSMCEQSMCVWGEGGGGGEGGVHDVKRSTVQKLRFWCVVTFIV